MNYTKQSKTVADALTMFKAPTEPQTQDAVNNITGITDALSMPAPYDSFDEVFRKDILIGQYDWATTSPIDTVLFNIQLPQKAIYNPIKYILDNNTFVKPSLNVKIVINATNMHQGSFLAYFKPVIDYDYTVQSASSLNKIYMNANKQVIQELHIPFDHIFSALTTFPTDGFQQLGYLEGRVLNALQHPDSTTVKISIYANFSETKAFVPVANHVYAQSGIAGIFSDIGQVVNDATNAIQGGAKIVSKITECVPMLDNPNLDLPPSDRIIQTTTHGVGGFGGIRLDIAQNARTLHDESMYCSEEDEMDLNNIIKKSGIFDIVNIDTTQVSGTLLRNWINTPNTYIYRPAVGTTIYPTPLAFVSRAFQKWRGDVVLTLDFINTPFHKCQLLLTYTPYAAAIPTFEQAKNSPQIVLDISERSRFTLTIPYVAFTNYKFNPVSWNTPIGWPTLINDCGIIQLWVLNPLLSSGTVVDNIQMNAWVCAGDNFQLESRARFLNYNAQSGYVAEADRKSVV